VLGSELSPNSGTGRDGTARIRHHG
jgi:hypothetical protein